MKTIQFSPVSRTLRLTGAVTSYMAGYVYKKALEFVFGTDLDIQLDAEDATFERMQQLQQLRQLGDKITRDTFKKSELYLYKNNRQNRMILESYKNETRRLRLEVAQKALHKERISNEGIVGWLKRNTVEAAYNMIVASIKFVANMIIYVPKAIVRGIFNGVTSAVIFVVYTAPAVVANTIANATINAVMGCAKGVDYVFNTVATGCINIAIYPFKAVANGVTNFVKSILFGKSNKDDVQATDEVEADKEIAQEVIAQSESYFAERAANSPLLAGFNKHKAANSDVAQEEVEVNELHASNAPSPQL